MVDGFGGGVLRGKEVERTMQEVVEVIDGGIRFSSLRKTVAKIPGGESLNIVASDAKSWVDEMGVAEGVKLGFARGYPDDVRAEK